MLWLPSDAKHTERILLSLSIVLLVQLNGQISSNGGRQTLVCVCFICYPQSALEGVIPGISEDRRLGFLKYEDHRYDTLKYEEVKTQGYQTNYD